MLRWLTVWVVAVALALVALVLPSAALADTTVDFDGLSPGTVVTDQYANAGGTGQGVVFGPLPGGAGDSGARPVVASAPAQAHSGSQVARIDCPTCNEGLGFVPDTTGTFGTSHSSISVWVGDLGSTVTVCLPSPAFAGCATVTLTAYNADGQPVGTPTIARVRQGQPFAQLSVQTSSPEIAAFEIKAGQDDSNKEIAIDDLSFNSPTTPPAPDFTLTPAASTISVVQGKIENTAISIGRLNGSSGGIQLAARGLPPGLHANFSPDPAGGRVSTLTLSADRNAPPTSNPNPKITVTGTPSSSAAGPAAHSFPLSVAVRAGPPIALITAPPSASTFARGQPASMTFVCRAALGGPGLRACTACHKGSSPLAPLRCASSASKTGGVLRLDTSKLGVYTYTVTAVSGDGQRASATLQYIVARFRPAVLAPPTLLTQAGQPCVIYRCPRNPSPHTAWENSLGLLQTDWCANYGCNKPMDLVPANGFDDNMFPFNPDWAYFLRTGRPPDALKLCGHFVATNGSLGCTSDPVNYDEAGLYTVANTICSYGPDLDTRPPPNFIGHVNWEPATYEGTLQWEEKSPPGTDDEYSLQLFPFNLDGATAGNNGGDSLHVEFDSDETIDHFDSSFWWKEFHSIVDNFDPHEFIDGALAEVTGLVGIDTVHTPAAELHPVWAMAIEDKAAGNQVRSTGNDLWAFFARNWGNEGYCSQHDHTIPVSKVTVRIPWLYEKRGIGLAAQPRPATAVKIAASFIDYMNVSGRHVGASARVLPGEGILLTFNLDSPSQQGEYWGTINLKWIFGGPSDMPPTLPPGSPRNRAPSAHLPHLGNGEANGDVEGLAGKLWQRLPPATRAKALAELPSDMIGSGRVRHTRLMVLPAPTSPLIAGTPFIPPVVDQPVLTRGKSELRLLCAAYKDHVPKFPGLCKPARPPA
jgi:hypothetical protein